MYSGAGMRGGNYPSGANLLPKRVTIVPPDCFTAPQFLKKLQKCRFKIPLTRKPKQSMNRYTILNKFVLAKVILNYKNTIIVKKLVQNIHENLPISAIEAAPTDAVYVTRTDLKSCSPGNFWAFVANAAPSVRFISIVSGTSAHGKKRKQ